MGVPLLLLAAIPRSSETLAFFMFAARSDFSSALADSAKAATSVAMRKLRMGDPPCHVLDQLNQLSNDLCRKRIIRPGHRFSVTDGPARWPSRINPASISSAASSSKGPGVGRSDPSSSARRWFGMGDIDLLGTVPNGQLGILLPRRMLPVVASRAVLGGQDLGEPVRARGESRHRSPASARPPGED